MNGISPPALAFCVLEPEPCSARPRRRSQVSSIWERIEAAGSSSRLCQIGSSFSSRSPASCSTPRPVQKVRWKWHSACSKTVASADTKKSNQSTCMTRGMCIFGDHGIIPMPSPRISFERTIIW